MKIQKGQSMFEVVLALFIITMIIVAVVILSTNSISNSLFSRNKTLANRYSQEAIEWLRSEREANIALFKTRATGVYCLQQPIDWLNTGSCGSTEVISANSIFTRQVNFTVITSPTIIKAEVVTSWSDSRGVHQAISTTEFSDIREK